MSEIIISKPVKKFKIERAKAITDGFAVCQNAILEISEKVSERFYRELVHNMAEGLVTIHTVRVVDVVNPSENYWGA